MKQQAKAIGMSMPISTKDTIEISNYIRGRSVERALVILEKAAKKEEPIPFTKFTNGVGHRRGNLASGRYPILAAKAIIKIIKSAKANAQVKGMNVDSLVIAQAIPNRGSRSLHYGRKRGIQTKSTHLTIVVEEGAVKESAKKTAKKAVKKAVKKEENAEEKTEAAKEKVEVKKETKEEVKAETKKEEKTQAPKKETKTENKKPVKKESQENQEDKE